MGVLSDDFAAVDIREELCYHSRPKKTNLRGALSGHETNERKPCAAGNTEPIPKRISGDGSAPPRFRFGVPVIFLFAFPWRVLGCGARQRAALVYAKHTPRCQNLF